MTIVDWLVLAPLIPFMPIIVTWWLPWEQWLPIGKYPHVVGPVFLYGAFAAWYFAAGWWAISILAVVGVVVCAFVVWAALYKPSLEQSENEP